MNRIARSLVLLSALVLLMPPGIALGGPANCAFVDVDDDGLFGPGDVVVPDAQWLGGQPFTTSHPFVVPAGCALPDMVTLPSPLLGVQVTATKITFLGTLTYLPPGGKGVVLVADPAQVPPPAGLGDGSLTIGNGVASKVKIEAGGRNALPTTIPTLPQKAIALFAAGDCSINNAEIVGNRPLQDTRVGLLCTGDVMIRRALIKGSRVNIQSLTGKIDARSAYGTGINLAQACDDSTLNLLGRGNSNGVLDAADFPCQVDFTTLGIPPGISPTFASAADLLQFCQDPDVAGQNVFQAFSDPLIMIAKQDLDLRGVAGDASGRTQLVGKDRVTLVSESGKVNTAYADVNHTDSAPGGAYAWLFASPTSVTRLPVDREDIGGPSGLNGATIDITGACYQGPNPVQVGKRANGTLPLVGTPASPPCKQLGDFVPVLSGNF